MIGLISLLRVLTHQLVFWHFPCVSIHWIEIEWLNHIRIHFLFLYRQSDTHRGLMEEKQIVWIRRRSRTLCIIIQILTPSLPVRWSVKLHMYSTGVAAETLYNHVSFILSSVEISWLSRFWFGLDVIVEYFFKLFLKTAPTVAIHKNPKMESKNQILVMTMFQTWNKSKPQWSDVLRMAVDHNWKSALQLCQIPIHSCD